MDVMENIKTGKYKNPDPYPEQPQNPTPRQKEEWRKKMKMWRDETYRLEREVFREDLAKQFGLDGVKHAKKEDLVWLKAWNDGHSSGLQEVYQHYEELAEIALA